MKAARKWLVLGVLLVALVVVTSSVAMAQTPVSLKVYDPTGAFQVSQSFSARVSDLNGKVICQVTNGSWQADRTDKLINELLTKQFPTAKIITTDKFPKLLTTSDVAGLEDAVKAAGCQAAIVGNAG